MIQSRGSTVRCSFTQKVSTSRSLPNDTRHRRSEMQYQLDTPGLVEGCARFDVDKLDIFTASRPSYVGVHDAAARQFHGGRIRVQSLRIAVVFAIVHISHCRRVIGLAVEVNLADQHWQR